MSVCGSLFQSLADDVRGRVADAVAELAGIGLGVGDQRLHGLVRLVRRHGDERGKAADPRNRREILDRVVGHVLEQPVRGRMRRVGGEQQRVAVVLGARDGARRQKPAGAGRFSTMNGWPSCSCSAAASTRAAASVTEPAANGVRMVTARVGYGSAANADGPKPKAAASSNAPAATLCRGFVMASFLPFCLSRYRYYRPAGTRSASRRGAPCKSGGSYSPQPLPPPD